MSLVSTLSEAAWVVLCLPSRGHCDYASESVPSHRVRTGSYSLHIFIVCTAPNLVPNKFWLVKVC